MLLAYEKGAELIVAVGTRFNLIEFLERNRAGMSSTFLTRLKVGEKLVDARGVSRLFRPRVGIGMVLAFALALGRGHRSGADRLARAAGPRLDARRAPPVAPRARMSRLEATGELLSDRRDVWALVAEPYHLPDWWPAYTGVKPDRPRRWPRARAGRWSAPRLPGFLRRAGGRGADRAHAASLEGWELRWHDVRQAHRRGRAARQRGHRAHPRHDLRLRRVAPARPRGRARPPAAALTRLRDLCQTAATLSRLGSVRSWRCSASAITWPRWRLSSSRSRSGSSSGWPFRARSPTSARTPSSRTSSAENEKLQGLTLDAARAAAGRHRAGRGLRGALRARPTRR